MYVGVTRAKRNLTLTCTVARQKYGRTVESMPSRFLYELEGKPPPPGWRAHGELAPREPAARGRSRTSAKGSGARRKSAAGRRKMASKRTGRESKSAP